MTNEFISQIAEDIIAIKKQYPDNPEMVNFYVDSIKELAKMFTKKEVSTV